MSSNSKGGRRKTASFVPAQSVNAAFGAPTLRRTGLGVSSLQAPRFGEKRSLRADVLQTDIRILFNDGRQLAGQDVYPSLTRRTWWAAPFYLFVTAPGMRRVFDAENRTFASHRYHICGGDRARLSRNRHIAGLGP